MRTLAGSETIDENKHAIKQVMLHRNGYFRCQFRFYHKLYRTTDGVIILTRKFKDDYSNDIALILLKTKITFDNYAGNKSHFRSYFRSHFHFLTGYIQTHLLYSILRKYTIVKDIVSIRIWIGFLQVIKF